MEGASSSLSKDTKQGRKIISSQPRINEFVRKFKADLVKAKGIATRINDQHRLQDLGPVPATQIAHPGCTSTRRHFRDWRKQGFMCTCGRGFAALNHLDRHLKNSMEPSVQIICKECNFIGSGQCCVNYHEMEVHPKPKPERFQCSYGCQMLFHSKVEMRLHQKER